jgi:hypothetical protein
MLTLALSTNTQGMFGGNLFIGKQIVLHKHFCRLKALAFSRFLSVACGNKLFLPELASHIP